MEDTQFARALGRLSVIFYLCLAGWFFVIAPWTRFWVTHVVPGAPPWLMPWLDNPAMRWAISAFGVLHFSSAASWLSPGVRQ